MAEFRLDKTGEFATCDYQQRVPDTYDGPKLAVRFVVDETVPIDKPDRIIPPKFIFGETKDGDKAYLEWLDGEGIPNKVWGTWEVKEKGGRYA